MKYAKKVHKTADIVSKGYISINLFLNLTCSIEKKDARMRVEMKGDVMKNVFVMKCT